MEVLTIPAAILWDLDGVLIDTAEFHFQAWKDTLAESGVTIQYEQFQRVFGMDNERTLAQLLGKPPGPAIARQISRRKEEAFRLAIRGHACLFPGVQNVLEAFHKNGRLQAIASSAPQENVDALVAELGIRHYFKAIVSAADLPGKPDPAVFLKAAQELEVAPQDCIVIEDSSAGIKAAHNAGMRVVAVTTTRPAEALADADLIVSSVAEFYAKTCGNRLKI